VVVGIVAFLLGNKPKKVQRVSSIKNEQVVHKRNKKKCE